MKIEYLKDSDLLHVEFQAGEVVDSLEASPGVILELDAEGHLLALGVHNASALVDLSAVHLSGLGGSP